MFTIAGVTGHVGGATARSLLGHGAPVRAVMRNPDHRAGWAAHGAETAIADLTDSSALTTALRGSQAAFVMLPTLPTGSDAGHRQMADSIAAAVAQSGVPHVVVLSSLGADLAEGTGPIRWLHHLESRLGETDATLSVLRSCHFQEKAELTLGAVLDQGVYPVFGERPEVAVPMIATRDIGTIAAEMMLNPPQASEVVDLLGPVASEQEVAERLSMLLDRPVQVVPIPQAGWVDAMVDAGLPASMAHELAALYDAESQGLLTPRGDRQLDGYIPLEQTLRDLVATAAPSNVS